MSGDPPPLAPYQGPVPPPAPLAVYQPQPAPTIRTAMRDELGRGLVRGMAKAGTYVAIGVGLYLVARLAWQGLGRWWAGFKSRGSRVEVREVPSAPPSLSSSPRVGGVESRGHVGRVRRPGVTYGAAVRAQRRGP